MFFVLKWRTSPEIKANWMWKMINRGILGDNLASRPHWSTEAQDLFCQFGSGNHQSSRRRWAELWVPIVTIVLLNGEPTSWSYVNWVSQPRPIVILEWQSFIRFLGHDQRPMTNDQGQSWRASNEQSGPYAAAHSLSYSLEAVPRQPWKLCSWNGPFQWKSDRFSEQYVFEVLRSWEVWGRLGGCQWGISPGLSA